MALLAPVVRQRARWHALRVLEVDPLTDTAVAVTFHVPGDLAAEFAFRPGQHLTLRASIEGNEVRQSYSIAMSPADARRRGVLRIASNRVPGGRMSTWLTQRVAPGDVIDVLAPLGSFTVEPDPAMARHHVAIAAGSGITPVLSIVTSVLHSEPRSRVTLLFGNRHVRSIMFLDELDDLKNSWPARFHVIHVLSREAHTAPLFSGRLDPARLGEIFERILPIDDVDEWYLCGPHGMVTGAQTLLADAGVAGERVHHEIFHVDDGLAPRAPYSTGGAGDSGDSGDSGDDGGALVTVTLDGRTTEVPMPSASETILAATLRARPDAPYSCTGGVCGTCRARLVSGRVRMDRTYALDQSEIDNGVILACQSHPITPTVVLTYDA